MPITLADLRAEADRLLVTSPEGEALDPLTRALISLGVRAAVTCLDKAAVDRALEAAILAGANRTQITETLALVSGLGVHTVMVAATRAHALVNSDDQDEPMDEERRDLWTKYMSDGAYWSTFEEEFPGVQNALLRLSTSLFRGFHEYSAIAWETRSVSALAKELIAAACDATPTHRFGPGLRLHVKNALKLGSGRRQILEMLDIAAAAPDHAGVG